jgi:hypothetical protein
MGIRDASLYRLDLTYRPTDTAPEGEIQGFNRCRGSHGLRACYSEFTGEYAAIRDFNSQSKHKKISPVAGLRWMREHARAWNEQIYVLHDFEHPLYSKHITPSGVEYRQLELEA